MIKKGTLFFRDVQKEYGNSISWVLLTFSLILILIPLNTLATSETTAESDLLKTYAPVLYFHPEEVSDVPRSSWIYWNGRWGDVKVLFWGSKGPESPGLQEKWKNPIKWGSKPQKSSFWVYFGSPGYLHIYDRYGNHVGVTEKGQKDTRDEIEGNIPGTYFYVPSSDKVPEACAWINTSEDLRFEIKATEWMKN
jgi:hypothetical protein